MDRLPFSNAEASDHEQEARELAVHKILDTGRTSSADPERPCLQKKEKICIEMSIDRPAVTPSNLMYV